jgi:hypothetical protein
MRFQSALCWFMGCCVPMALAPSVALALSLSACNGQFRFDELEGAAKDASSDSDGLRLPSSCLSDTDCRLASLHCKVAERTCVECTLDQHCTSDPKRARCDTGSGRCVTCKGRSDCGVGEGCESTTLSCVELCAATACKTPKSSCDDGICRTCENNAECRTPFSVCNRNVGRCAGCATNASCGGQTPRCLGSRGICVACVSSADCNEAALPLCDPASNTCVALPL